MFGAELQLDLARGKSVERGRNNWEESQDGGGLPVTTDQPALPFFIGKLRHFAGLKVANQESY